MGREGRGFDRRIKKENGDVIGRDGKEGEGQIGREGE